MGVLDENTPRRSGEATSSDCLKGIKIVLGTTQIIRHVINAPPRIAANGNGRAENLDVIQPPQILRRFQTRPTSRSRSRKEGGTIRGIRAIFFIIDSAIDPRYASTSTKRALLGSVICQVMLDVVTIVRLA